MLEQLQSFPSELLHNFRIADAIDILLVAVLLYCALLWFGETASRRMLVGVTLLALVYLAARVFDMHLTSLAFHTGFTVLLILLIVIFQEDLRRMISRTSGWISLSHTRTSDSDGESELLAKTAFSLANRRIGALLVLPGKEPLERHLSGGIRIDGELSRELLDSIFDPSSDGHDGAVIVVDNRIERFGVHLPISTNLKVIQGRGTRHSAAVGLSECSDATVVVVSEERGTVAVAKAGRLMRVDSPAELLKQLDASSLTRGADDNRSAWKRHLLAHWRMKVLALSMAMIAWFVLAYNPTTVARSFDVPIEYRKLPTGLILDQPVPQVRMTLSGTEANFRFLSPETLKISIDLNGLPPGSHAVTLGEEHIQLPANVAIDSMEPDVLWLYLRQQPPKPPSGG